MKPYLAWLFLATLGNTAVCSLFWAYQVGLFKMICRRGRAILSGCGGAMVLFSAMLAAPSTVLAWSSSLNFIYPLDNQIVGGPNLMLYAATNTPRPDRVIIFELSLDGTNFVKLPQQEAPDFGAGSYTTSVDTTALPVGSVFFRARFAADTIGPIISVQVRRTPTPSCQVSRQSSLSIILDCSATQDENGGITAYDFNFGDNTPEVTTTSPSITHSYSALGTYPVSITATDAINLSTTLYKQLVLVRLTLLKNRPMCGCSQMTVASTGMSTLADLRRPNGMGGFNPAPLGADPDFLSFNFEVSATLTPDSDPTLCMEGQEVRRTATNAITGAAVSKMACAAGRMPLLASCVNDRQCDTLTTCNGGVQNGQSCATAAGVQRCLLGGGTCRRLMDGMCTPFPFDGANGPRGSDDYRSPFPDDGGTKLHAPPTGMPIWIDFPGLPKTVTHANAPRDFRYDADFLATVTGAGGNCSCHFVVVIDWNNMTKMYRPATGLTIEFDEDSVNCSE